MSEMRSYYGRPVLKEPVWKQEIPWYLFTGGLGGASAVLSAVARVATSGSRGAASTSAPPRTRSAPCF